MTVVVIVIGALVCTTSTKLDRHSSHFPCQTLQPLLSNSLKTLFRRPISFLIQPMCLAFPFNKLNGLGFSSKSYKWIRYTTGIVIETHGDLCAQCDLPAVPTDSPTLASQLQQCNGVGKKVRGVSRIEIPRLLGARSAYHHQVPSRRLNIHCPPSSIG